MWIPDLFMERVAADETWSTFCPSVTPGLANVWGEEYVKLYTKYEQEGRAKEQMPARTIWNAIIQAQTEAGVPYLLYKDACNSKSNQRNIGTIRSSNLCVTGETLVLTERGCRRIKELVDSEHVRVWNGNNFSLVQVKQTGTKQQLMKVTTSTGAELTCTPYHKFYLEGLEEPKAASDLQPGDRLKTMVLPFVKWGAPDNKAYDKGWECCVGQFAMEKADKKPTYDVPFKLGVSARLKWLAGLVDATGFIRRTERSRHLVIVEANQQFLREIQCMLQTMDVGAMIRGNELIIVDKDLDGLLEAGFDPYRGHVYNSRDEDWHDLDNTRSPTVVSVERLTKVADTYCFDEPENHMAFFNGIYCGNCTEIIEFSSQDETAVCLVGETEVLTETGLRRLDTCGGATVLAPFDDTDDTVVQRPSFVRAGIIDNGMQDVFEIQLGGTKPIKATANHRFLIQTSRNYDKKVNSYSWKTVSQLTPGDRVVVPDHLAVPQCADISIDQDLDTEYLTAGWLLGDGWQLKSSSGAYGACFGKHEEEAVSKVIPMLNAWHDDAPLLSPYGRRRPVLLSTNAVGTMQWSSSKQGFVAFIQNTFGLMPSKGPTKVMPDKIKYDATPIQQASMLSGYFSADGSVYGNHNKPYVSLSSASQMLLWDTQAMLRCFGIQSKVGFYLVASRNRSQGRLIISGVANLKRFQTHINFMLCKEKRDQLESVLKTTVRVQVPQEREWCPVIDIIPAGKAVVYDLSLPKAHTFLAAGAVTHNCNLSSIALPKFVTEGRMDYQKLHSVTKLVTKATNEVIDRTFYPVEQARRSNMRHRPIGLGVQGLADIFAQLRLPWDSEGAAEVNKKVFATIYHAACEASVEMAKDKGAYETFQGSPASQGLLQPDLWEVAPDDMWDWDTLKADIQKHGMRNSLLVAPMPTASTSQILGNTECIEPCQSCIYTRSTISGQFVVVNKYLVKELITRGLWTKEVKDRIVAAGGSVQGITGIPDDIKSIYKTAWEIKQKVLINLAADRGPYIDQSQSLNLFMAEPNMRSLSAMHFHAWRRKLKTGCYYLRSKAAASAQRFTVDPSLESPSTVKKTVETECVACSA